MTDLKILPSTRGVIESKLRDDVIAILVTREDLRLNILGLDRLMTTAVSGDALNKIEALRDEFLELKKVGFE